MEQKLHEIDKEIKFQHVLKNSVEAIISKIKLNLDNKVNLFGEASPDSFSNIISKLNFEIVDDTFLNINHHGRVDIPTVNDNYGFDRLWDNKKIDGLCELLQKPEDVILKRIEHIHHLDNHTVVTDALPYGLIDFDAYSLKPTNFFTILHL